MVRYAFELAVKRGKKMRVTSITKSNAQGYGMVLWDEVFAGVAKDFPEIATESLRKYPAELWRSAASTVPLQRLGEMHEYGWLVALLASPLGCAFSGSVVTQDGALDNFPGRWPPEGLEREGAVPTEERRPPG